MKSEHNSNKKQMKQSSNLKAELIKVIIFSAEELLVGGRSMSVLPVTFSLAGDNFHFLNFFWLLSLLNAA